MSLQSGNFIRRREFVKQAGALSVLGLSEKKLGAFSGRVALITDETDSNISNRPVKWAIEELRQAIELHQTQAVVAGSPGEARDAALFVVVAGGRSPLSQSFRKSQAFPTARGGIYAACRED